MGWLRNTLIALCLAAATPGELKTYPTVYEGSSAEYALPPGVRIYINAPEEEHDAYASAFARSYESVRQGWDNLDNKVRQINYIILSPSAYVALDSAAGLAYRETHGIELREPFGTGTFVHELCHVLQADLPRDESLHQNEDERRFFSYYWSRDLRDKNGYFYDILYYDTDTNNVRLERTGVVSRYALKNNPEDVAETCRFVYAANNDMLDVFYVDGESGGYNPFFSEFRHVTNNPLTIGRIDRLRDAGFISVREHDNALSRLLRN